MEDGDIISSWSSYVQFNHTRCSRLESSSRSHQVENAPLDPSRSVFAQCHCSKIRSQRLFTTILPALINSARRGRDDYTGRQVARSYIHTYIHTHTYQKRDVSFHHLLQGCIFTYSRYFASKKRNQINKMYSSTTHDDNGLVDINAYKNCTLHK